ncbi:MAG TPA: transporter substrate-binding domain-containing protein [Acetobacteraceae bacterium]|nr:transporter substrate-binding domain-containing protein [Acetobacteraceae bacterium]
MHDLGRRGLLALAGAAAIGGGAAAAEDALARVKSAGVLRVGTETQFAPFDFLENGKATGLNYDLFAELGKDLGWRIDWVALPWESVLPGLDAGKFDMVAGPATITKARMERYRFTPPIAEATCGVLKKAGDASITKPADIAGKAVGSGKATAQLEQLRKYAATLSPPPQVREYVDFGQAYADLAAGRIVAVANSLPNIAYVAAQRPDTFALVPTPFGEKSYFGYIGRKDPEYAGLMDTVDAEILKMKADGRLAKLQEKWFKTTFETPDRVSNPGV